MREVISNIELTLPSGEVLQGLTEKAMAHVPAAAFICEKCGYVEFYGPELPFG